MRLILALLLFVVVVIVIPVAKAWFKRQAARTRVLFMEDVARKTAGRLEPAKPDGEPAVFLSIGGAEGRLSYHHVGSTVYTQLGFKLAPGPSFPLVLAPRSERDPLDGVASVAGHLLTLESVVGAAKLLASLATKLSQSLSRSPMVATGSALFDTRFMVFSPEPERVHAVFDEELRDRLLDFCSDARDYKLYLHVGEDLELSKMEELQSFGEFERFLDLGRMMVEKFRRAAVMKTAFVNVSPAKEVICAACGHPVLNQARACERCSAVHHLDCWLLQDGCSRCMKTTGGAAH